MRETKFALMKQRFRLAESEQPTRRSHNANSPHKGDVRSNSHAKLYDLKHSHGLKNFMTKLLMPKFR